ncbi:hypothetical protein ABZ593_21075 [Streptomyces sp. NPDC012617]|uniref:hypothetical protein n=1 Tax=Streptomyces TaxID=1883 RepID=UPI0033D822BD
MSQGCRDCGTCTKPGLARLAQNWAVGALHLCTAGISWLIKRGTRRHCPQCRHQLAGHQRRRDGAFID